MVFSIIQKSQLEGANRLDAEYYQPEYLELLKVLRKKETINLDSLTTKITQGPNPTFINEGKSCLNGRNIKNNRVDIENSNYVSEKEFGKFNDFKVKVNDILITLKGLGSIGKTGLVFDDIDCIFSRDIGLIRLASQQWARYVYAFLLSKYGEKQIERASSGGTGQLTLATSYLKRLKIHKPNLVQVKFVSDIIKWSEEEYKKSNELYFQAENLLLEELGLKNFKVQEDLTFIVNYSDVQKANRMDADYFQPKYERLISNLKTQKAKLLPEVLLVLVKSLIMKMQLQKRCVGTILMAVPSETLKDVLIPVLGKPIQQKIADLVKKSHEARKKSKELLEEAKRKVEEMIEKGDKNK